MHTHSKARVLFLWEDDEDFATMFFLFLQKHGYSMEAVKTFGQCIEICKCKPPDLLILRSLINEPQDGLEFVRKMRSNVNIPYFPVIIGLAYAPFVPEEQSYNEAFEAGANACFGRVFDISDVLEQIKILVNDPKATGIVDRQTTRLQNRKNQES